VREQRLDDVGRARVHGRVHGDGAVRRAAEGRGRGGEREHLVGGVARRRRREAPREGARRRADQQGAQRVQQRQRRARHGRAHAEGAEHGG
jgi:hypothetical protein